MVARRRRVLTLVLYVVQVLALAVLTYAAFRWNMYVGVVVGACLIDTLIPLGAVWWTWRERREAARLGLPRPE